MNYLSQYIFLILILFHELFKAEGHEQDQSVSVLKRDAVVEVDVEPNKPQGKSVRLDQFLFFIHSQTLPFSSVFHHGLGRNFVVTIEGKTTLNADSFTINILSDQGCKKAIAFHFRLYVKTGKVVMNTASDSIIGLNGSTGIGWGSSEFENLSSFKAGEAFKIVIRKSKTGYQGSINGKEQTFYGHRIHPVIGYPGVGVHNNSPSNDDVTLYSITLEFTD